MKFSRSRWDVLGCAVCQAANTAQGQGQGQAQAQAQGQAGSGSGSGSGSGLRTQDSGLRLRGFAGQRGGQKAWGNHDLSLARSKMQQSPALAANLTWLAICGPTHCSRRPLPNGSGRVASDHCDLPSRTARSPPQLSGLSSCRRSLGSRSPTGRRRSRRRPTPRACDASRGRRSCRTRFKVRRD